MLLHQFTNTPKTTTMSKSPHAKNESKTRAGERLLELIRAPDKSGCLPKIREQFKNGADVAIPYGDTGNTVLHEICKFILDDTNQDVFLEVFKHCGGLLEAKNFKGETALHLARDSQVARTLLKNGANVNSLDYSENTPILRQFSRPDILGVLISHGGWVDHRNSKGLTALQMALLHGHEHSALLLLENGADVNIKTDFNYHLPVQMVHVLNYSPGTRQLVWKLTKPANLLSVLKINPDLKSTILREFQERVETSRDFKVLLEEALELLGHFSLHYSDRIQYAEVFLEFFLNTLMSRTSELGFDFWTIKNMFEAFSDVLEKPILNFYLKMVKSPEDSCEKNLLETSRFILRYTGEIVDLSDLEVVYLQLGDCFLLRFLLNFNIQEHLKTSRDVPVFVRALYDLSFDLRSFFKRYLTGINVLDLYNYQNLSRFCTLPQRVVGEFADTYEDIKRFENPPIESLEGVDEVIEGLKSGPKIPSLLELSRDQSRVVLGVKYGLKGCLKGCQLMDMLAIPKPIQDLLFLRVPFYDNIGKPRYFPHVKHLFPL